MATSDGRDLPEPAPAAQTRRPSFSRRAFQARFATLDWRAKARWFGAEYLVVVFGVLTAVGINAWWGDRQDRGREAEYLRQLAEDVEGTLLELDLVEEVMAEGDRASVELVRAFQNPAGAPKDSLLAWLHVLGYNEQPTVLSRTAESLIATGDLRIIQDDSIRHYIPVYVGYVSTLLAYSRRNHEARGAATSELVRRADPIELNRAAEQRSFPGWWAIGDTSSARPMAVRFPLDPDAFLGDRAAYENAWVVSTRRNFLYLNRKGIRRTSVEFRDLLQRRTAAE